MKLLLNRYHPVVDDLAFSFIDLGFEVEICVDTSVSDHYGSHSKIIAENNTRYKEFKTIPLSQALIHLKNKKYNLVGVDGVYSGDKLIMDVCKDKKIPYFAICGYPHSLDEPSNNILSFSWFLSEKQYRHRYPNEGHIKHLDWKNIAEGRLSADCGKNICVYYPPFKKLKDFMMDGGYRFFYHRDDKFNAIPRNEFISLIHRFEECNKESYEVFTQVQKSVPLTNYSNLSQQEVWNKIHDSYGFIHSKVADCPGISLLESMIMGRVPIVMKSFVLASQNQDLLIDEHSAIICDSTEEMIERAKNHKGFIDDLDGALDGLEESTRRHAFTMTDMHRQKNKLKTFVDRCF